MAAVVERKDREQVYLEHQHLQGPAALRNEKLLQQHEEIDAFEPPPEIPEKPVWKKWLGRGVTALATGGAIAIRLTNYSRWTNAIGSIGTGALALASISWGHKDVTMARIRQVSLTTLGMGTFFFLSQLYANTGAGGWHTFATHASMGLLGANVQVVLKWLWQQRGVQTESHAASVRGNRMSEVELISRWPSTAMKVAASVGALVCYFYFSSPIAQGLSSFAASYWLSHQAGALGLKLVNRQIEKYENSISQADYSFLTQGTRWRTFKRVCNTVGHIAIPLCFIPWNVKPDTAERLAQLVYVGAILGLSSGFTEESEKERIRNIPVTELEELNKLEAPDEDEASWKYYAWRTWHIAVPLISSLGLIGFTAWQLDVLKNRYAKIAVGMTLGGFLGSQLGCKYIDYKWDPSHLHFWRDWSMTNIWVAPRIFGMNPLYIYLAGTNAVLMDNHALQEMKGVFPISVALVSWGMYGLAMGREIYITASDRIGNQLKWPLMLFVNAAITAKLSIAGQRGVP